MNKRNKWESLKKNVYYRDGSLRDIYIFDTDDKDWEKFIVHVNKKYTIEWFNTSTKEENNQIDFTVVKDILLGNSELVSTAKIFVEYIQINAHFFTSTEIENDIDPREFNSLDDHCKLIQYMVELSNLLDKKVVLSPENVPECHLIHVDKKGVIVNSGCDMW